MVAAALYRLWTTESSPEPEPEPAPKPALSPPPGKAKPAGQGRSTKVFVTAGKKDGATPADFVAMLTRDLKVPPEHIGKIDLHETFSLIELPADQAEAVAESLTGRTIRRRKIIARLERQR
jgi:ATP-dependent RNA helicase DeaD